MSLYFLLGLVVFCSLALISYVAYRSNEASAAMRNQGRPKPDIRSESDLPVSIPDNKRPLDI